MNILANFEFNSQADHHRSGAMKIRVEHFKEKPHLLCWENRVESFPVLAEMQTDGVCSFNGPILSEMTVSQEFDHVRVSGVVRANVVLDCSRCLVSFHEQLKSTFTIFYRKASVNDMIEEDEIELDEQDLVSASYSGDEIDFTHEIQEQVAMEIPLKPLCREGCKGLCQVCGTDLNQNLCSCQHEHTNSKFSALKDFIALKA